MIYILLQLIRGFPLSTTVRTDGNKTWGAELLHRASCVHAAPPSREPASRQTISASDKIISLLIHIHLIWEISFNYLLTVN